MKRKRPLWNLAYLQHLMQGLAKCAGSCTRQVAGDEGSDEAPLEDASHVHLQQRGHPRYFSVKSCSTVSSDMTNAPHLTSSNQNEAASLPAGNRAVQRAWLPFALNFGARMLSIQQTQDAEQFVR